MRNADWPELSNVTTYTTPRATARSYTPENGVATRLQSRPPSVVAMSCVSVKAKPCVASANRTRPAKRPPIDPTRCHVRPPSVVSSTGPLLSAQPCSGETKLAENALNEFVLAGVVVVVVVDVLGVALGAVRSLTCRLRSAPSTNDCEPDADTCRSPPTHHDTPRVPSP